ncbi:uncharacterized protein LOC128271104 [Anopheles cruzii]|uniref:uncharacterized protein LOC128271104 n=1 Tax=Anopheles cruzii TaxID=68878 RepID=UPI0022EC3C29|nr:uncharacterized protein LOC128271104 [Anopheles cruzii]
MLTTQHQLLASCLLTTSQFSDVESSDLSSSDSEGLLDEIVIASARIDDPCHYDPLSSPIHYCDNNVHSDDNSNSNNNTIIRIDSIEESQGSSSSGTVVVAGGSGSSSAGPASAAAAVAAAAAAAAVGLNPSSAYKNSKSRRMEYSRRGMILGLSNPSQDSAFGSMTDGESSRASSFKLSSFASMNSPIDEGVEDLLAEQSAADNLATTIANMKYIDSTGSSPCHDYHCAVSNSRTEPSIASRDISPSRSRFLEPPKLMINNHSASTTNSSLCYTLSPLRKCATTEVFSQKYRVSSFEDMSCSSSHKSIKNTARKIFRSFEEERRIDSAFMPIDTGASTSRTVRQQHQQPGLLQPQLSLPPMSIAGPSSSSPSPKHHHPSGFSPSHHFGYQQPAASPHHQLSKKNHASYQNLHTIVPTARERGLQWRSNLIKSNECLFETSFNCVPTHHPYYQQPQQQQQQHPSHSFSSFHGHGSQDLPTGSDCGSSSEMSGDRFTLTPEPGPGTGPESPACSVVASSSTSRLRPNRTDRAQLFSLARFKHNAILDSVSIEDISSDASLRQGTGSPVASPCRSAASVSSSSAGEPPPEFEAKRLSSDVTCTSDASDTTSEDTASISTTDTSLLKSPLPAHRDTVAAQDLRHKHAPRDVRQYLDDATVASGGDFGSGSEEKTPLLEGMELSPIISPTESEQML